MTAVPIWLPSLLQLNDSFYPTGSYAHSFGLEGLIQENVVNDRATLRSFVFASVIPGLRQMDLPLGAHAWRALGALDWTRIGEICLLSSALKTAHETRSTAEKIGRQRLEMVASHYPHALVAEFLGRAEREAWPCSPSVAAAVEGIVHDWPLEAVLTSIYYGSVVSLLAAAMKLLRLGQNGCQGLLTEALGQAPRTIASALAVGFDEIGWYNPWLDIAAARHETADGRLFIS